MPSMGSRPTVAKKSPAAAEIMPLRGFFPDTVETMVRENSTSMAYSEGPNLRAMLARKPATKIRIRSLKVSAMMDAYRAIHKAFRALPCLARGYPSRAVAAEAGVPGVFMSIAVMDPP